MTTPLDATAKGCAAFDAGSGGAQRRLGEVIADRYRVIRLVRQGGMGTVYEAHHTRVKRRFAIKFLNADLMHKPDAVRRFEREAAAAGILENENVAAALDFGYARDGAPYIVMEYLEGQDLADILAQTGPLSSVRATRLIVQACRGLEAAHDKGIVHRDLKPRNLFVCPREPGGELLKVLDFGIAKLTNIEANHDATKSGVLVGTPFYMAPEQLRGDASIDCRADVYAMGVVLYELLTTERPHPGKTYGEVFYSLITRVPTPIERLRPNLPPALCAIVHRAMATDAAERFASASAFRDALAPFTALPDVAAGAYSFGSAAADAVTLATRRGLERSTLRGAAASAPRRPPRVRIVIAIVAALAILTTLGARLIRRPERLAHEAPRTNAHPAGSSTRPGASHHGLPIPAPLPESSGRTADPADGAAIARERLDAHGARRLSASRLLRHDPKHQQARLRAPAVSPSPTASAEDVLRDPIFR